MPPHGGQQPQGHGSGKQPGHKRRKVGAGLSLHKFAKAKQSSFDKRAIREKERALNAARVNKYRKLKSRLGDKLAPLLHREDRAATPPPDQPAELSNQAEQPQQQQKRQRRRHKDQQLGEAAATVSAAAAEPPVLEQHEAGPSHLPPTNLRRQPQQVRVGAAATAAEEGGQGTGVSSGRGKFEKHKRPASSLQRMAAEVQARKEAEVASREAAAQAAAQRRQKLEEEARQRAARGKLFRKRTQRGQPVMRYRVDKVLQQLGAA